MTTTQPNSMPVAIGAALNTKYQAAWAEINTRIGQRQDAMRNYVNLSIILISVSHLHLKQFEKIPEIITLAVPSLSILFVYLTEMHEVQIAVLRSFLNELEEFSEDYLYHDPDHEQRGLPPVFYHHKSKRGFKADTVRQKHDHVCIALIIGLNFFSMFATVLDTETDYFSNFELFEFIVTALFAVLVLYAICRASGIAEKRQKAYDEVRGRTEQEKPQSNQGHIWRFCFFMRSKLKRLFGRS